MFNDLKDWDKLEATLKSLDKTIEWIKTIPELNNEQPKKDTLEKDI